MDDVWGDCEGCMFDGYEYDYDQEPCCRCRRNINLYDEYRPMHEEDSAE